MKTSNSKTHHHRSLKKMHEEVSPHHYDRGVATNILQRVWHKKRIEELIKILPQKKGEILDIGCHSGFLLIHIFSSLELSHLTGIDVSHNAIVKATKRIPQARFITTDAHHLPLPSNHFDLITCIEMLEHVENPNQIIKEMYRVLKPNGTCIVMVPTNSILFETIWYTWNLLFPVWQHTHIQKFSSHSLQSLITNEGFHIESTKSFLFGMLVIIRFKKK